MRISKKQLMLILILVLGIVVLESFEVLFLSKDLGLYKEFQRKLGTSLTFDEYISYHMMSFFRKIHIPVVLALFTYFGRRRFSFGNLYKGIFSLLLLISIFYRWSAFRTIFMIPVMVLEIILLLLLMNLQREEQDGKI